MRQVVHTAPKKTATVMMRANVNTMWMSVTCDGIFPASGSESRTEVHANENIPLTEPFDSIASVKPGTGPRHIAFHPARPDVYIIGELTGTVDAFHFNASSGKMTHFQRIRTTPEHFKGDAGSADIHIRADGKFLYATNRGTSNTIAVFAIRKDGRLATKQIISVKGKHPRNFVIDPSSHFLLVANRDTDNIVIFSIDPASGLLKATGKEISIPNPVCLKFLAN